MVEPAGENLELELVLVLDGSDSRSADLIVVFGRPSAL
jgi:hypothetical protein